MPHMYTASELADLVIVAFRCAKGHLFAERKATFRELDSAKIVNGIADHPWHIGTWLDEKGAS